MRNILYPAGKASYLDKKAVIEGEDSSVEEASSAAQLLVSHLAKRDLCMNYSKKKKKIYRTRRLIWKRKRS